MTGETAEPPTVQRALRQLDELFPWRHAAPDDPVCGLLLGERTAPAARAILALDCTPAVADEASANAAQLLLTWKPPWQESLTAITDRTAAGRIVMRLARSGTALVVGGTAWDATPGGLSDTLIGAFQCRKTRPLIPSTRPAAARVGITVDMESLDPVLNAFGKSGVPPEALDVKPLGGSMDTGGAAMQRVEATVTDENRKNVMTAVAAASPDGDARLDHVLLGNTEKPVGSGRVGELPQRVVARQVMADLKKLLEVSHVRVLGALGQKVKRLAMAHSGGPEVVCQAINYGANCLIAGDVSYDAGRIAADAGLIVLDPGHVPLAWWALRQMLPRIQAALPGVELVAASTTPHLFT